MEDFDSYMGRCQFSKGNHFNLIATKAATGSLYNCPDSFRFAGAGINAHLFLSISEMVLGAAKTLSSMILK